MVKFHHGLQHEIQDQIALLGTGQPNDNDPEAWYQAAIRCDENCITNAVFHSTLLVQPARVSSTLVFPRHPPSSQWTTNKTLFTTPPRTVLPSASSTPTLVKTEDLQKKLSCFRCGSTDHLKPDCPQHFDIRFMTLDEKEEWQQDFNLIRESDIARIEGEDTAEVVGSTGMGFTIHNE